MRSTTHALIKHYMDLLDLRGDVLEIGGHRLEKSAAGVFPAPRFNYHDLNLVKSNIPQTIPGNITDCRDGVPDASFDVVYTSDVFEHIDKPWLAADEIARILRPGGIAIVWTLWSWRNHPCPIDYWRFSPECLEFLFSKLTCLEKGYDLSARRVNQPGRWKNGKDSVPVDALGGWRENWAVYCVVGREVSAPSTRFKDTEAPEARYLRMDTQGVVTNPELLGVPVSDEREVVVITKQLSRQIDEIAAMVKDLSRSTLRRATWPRLTSRRFSR